MLSLGFHAKNETIFRLISELDQDGSGLLEFDEFLELMTSKVTGKESKDKLGKLFGLYDSEHKGKFWSKSGYVTIEDLTRVSQELNTGSNKVEL